MYRHLVDIVNSQLKAQGWGILSGLNQVVENTDMLEGFSRLFGNPSIRDGGVAVWPIQARKERGTFSEISGEADLHTDAQYHNHPEQLIILACARHADVGGESYFLDVPGILQSLVEANFSSEDIRLLQQPIWRWRVPQVFMDDSRPSECEPAKILYDGKVRWRYDNLIVSSPGQQELANRFHRVINGSPYKRSLALKQGDILVCSNEYVLHGRAQFTDPKRLLYRVRLTT